MEPDPKLLPALERLADKAKDMGASDIELLEARWTARSVEVRRAGAGPVTQHLGKVLRGRVYLEGGKAAGFSTRDPKSALQVITAALKRAKRSKAAATNAPSEHFPISERGQGLDDRRYELLSDHDRAEVALLNWQGCDQGRVVCQGSDYSEVRTTRAFFSTVGIAASSTDTRYDVRVQASLDDQRYSTTFQAAGRAFATIGALPYGRDLAKRLEELCAPPVQLPTGDVAVVLEPQVLASLVSRIGPAFCADRVLAGKSFVSKLSEGRIGGPRVHLVDDATLHGALLSRAFDDRGVAPMPVPLIQEGKRGGMLHSPETARSDRARPTGHDMDGNLSPSNLVLRRGNRSRTQMLGEVPLALQFDRLDGELNLETGEMELHGPAFVLEAGKRRGLVPRAVLRGNIVDLLMGTKELASNQKRYLNVDCATGVFLGFPVA